MEQHTTGRARPSSSPSLPTSERTAIKARDALEVARQLERDSKLQRLEEARTKVSKGALPEVFVLPIPEEDGSIAKMPTLLARVPVFSAGQPAHSEQGEVIETSFGRITRYGPGLTMTHEDVLMALLRLCWQKRIRGPRVAFPQVRYQHLSVVPADGDLPGMGTEYIDQMLANVETISGSATYYQLASFIFNMRGVDHRPGGRNVLDIKMLIEEIARVTLKIWRRDLKTFSYLHFFYLAGQEQDAGTIDEASEFTVLFHPEMVRMMSVYTLQDLAIRHEMSSVGKAVYRFVASQVWSKRPEYEIRLETLQAYTGSKSPAGRFKQMVDEGFCQPILRAKWAERAEIVGTGRKTPLKLVVRKAVRKPNTAG